jgi:DNA-binding MarR family transcriptional regulator
MLAGHLRRAIVLLWRQARRQAPSELTIAQLSALATVVRSGPIGVGQLAEAEVLPSPAMTRLADKLEEAGMVTRGPNPADRRGVLLVATAAGRELIGRRHEASNAWLAERLEALPAADRLALERAVPALWALAGEKEREKD